MLPFGLSASIFVFENFNDEKVMTNTEEHAICMRCIQYTAIVLLKIKN